MAIRRMQNVASPARPGILLVLALCGTFAIALMSFATFYYHEKVEVASHILLREANRVATHIGQRLQSAEQMAMLAATYLVADRPNAIAELTLLASTFTNVHSFAIISADGELIYTSARAPLEPQWISDTLHQHYDDWFDTLTHPAAADGRPANIIGVSRSNWHDDGSLAGFAVAFVEIADLHETLELHPLVRNTAFAAWSHDGTLIFDPTIAYPGAASGARVQPHEEPHHLISSSTTIDIDELEVRATALSRASSTHVHAILPLSEVMVDAATVGSLALLVPRDCM